MTLAECRPGRQVRWISNVYKHPRVRVVARSETKVLISIDEGNGYWRETWVYPRNLEPVQQEVPHA